LPTSGSRGFEPRGLPGLQATPHSFGLNESPPAAVHAPGSHVLPPIRIASGRSRPGVWHGFPQPALFPTGPLSTSRFPRLDVSLIHWLSIRLTPCESGGTLWSGCDPCPVQAGSEPPGLKPRLLAEEVDFQATSSNFGSARLSTIFTVSRRPHFTSRIRSPFNQACDIAFDRFEPMSPDRVLGRHATPVPAGGTVPPGRLQPAPGSRAFTECR